MYDPKADCSRRQVLRAGLALPLALTPAAASLGHESLETSTNSSNWPPTQVKPDYTLNITQKSVAPLGESVSATLVNDTLPGATIRYREGDMFRVLVNNRLDVPTTVHWHGMLVPCYMDGVPGINQLPIPPQSAVLYEYPLRQHGTYWYHSHYRFQEQTGLSGPLIIDAKDEPYSYDHDVVVFLSDWLNQSPDGIIPQIRGTEAATAAVKPIENAEFTFPGEKRFVVDVNYPGFLLNGHSSAKPWTLKVQQGDRIRLRFINGSTSSFFQAALDGHQMHLIAADGQYIEPLEIDNLVLGTAERYDALVTVKESGSFTLHAAALGTSQQALGVIHTADAALKINTAQPRFSGVSGGLGNYAALRSPEPTMFSSGPVRTIDVELGGDMKRYLWSMNGLYYPEHFVTDGKDEPLLVQAGERVRIRLTNPTMMYHPMHLHGHFFRLLGKPGDWKDTHAPLKDTLAIGPKQQLDFEFAADNPGRWFFHCHNLYHLATGMAREVRYQA